VLTSIGGVWVSNAAVASGGGTGTVTNVSVVSANGFSGTVANSTSNAAITLSATFIGIAWANSTGQLGNVAVGTGLSFSNTTGVLTATGAVANAVTSVGNTYPILSTGGTTPTISFVAPGTAGNVLTSISGQWVSNAAVGGGGTPGGNPGQIQYNNSGAFGGDANLTFSGSTTTAANLIVSNLTASLAVFSSSTKQLVSNPITGTGSVVMNNSPTITSPSLITPALGSPTSGNMVATTNIPVANATGTLAVGNGGTGLQTIPAGNVVIGNGTSALYGLAPGTAGNVLTSIGGIWVSNAAVTGSGSPGGSTTQFQYNNGGVFAGAANLTTDGANVTIGSANTFRFANLTSTRYVGFKANAIIAANVTWTLPTTDGTTGQLLSTDGSGVLSWTSSLPASGPTTVEALLVAGGGGGGGNGGGGGAGGLIYNASVSVSGGTSYPLTVGAGGPGGAGGSNGTIGTQGFSTTGFSLTAVGGGAGGPGDTAGTNGGNGGSGGGGGRSGATPPQSGGSATSGQGNAGGNAPNVNPYPSGGGGGAGGAGSAGSGSASGAGGIGLQNSITGSSIYYAGGGGGGGATATVTTAGAGTPSTGGGGAGSAIGNGAAGTANLGGGGGGGAGNSINGSGGNGGSGVLIIAYPDTYAALSSIGVGLTYTVSTSSRSGYRVYTFTAGTGSIQW
jgi:hypothetical protein